MVYTKYPVGCSWAQVFLPGPLCFAEVVTRQKREGWKDDVCRWSGNREGGSAREGRREGKEG